MTQRNIKLQLTLFEADKLLDLILDSNMYPPGSAKRIAIKLEDLIEYHKELEQIKKKIKEFNQLCLEKGERWEEIL